MPTDAELLARYVRAGDEAAFAEIVRRHLDVVFATALRKVGGRRQLAEEVAQSVFTDLARKSPGLLGHATVAGWLFLGAHYAAQNALRAERRRLAREHALAPMLEPESSIGGLGAEDARTQIDELLRQLQPAEREAILLRFIAGLGFEEIGDRLNISASGARARVDRAVERLRARLARRGITSTAAALAATLAAQAAPAAPAELVPAVQTAALAAGVANGTGALALMATAKITVIAIGAFALLAVAGALYERNLAHTYRDTLSAADARSVRLAAALKRSVSETLAAKAEAASLQTTLRRMGEARSRAASRSPRSRAEVLADLAAGRIRLDNLANLGNGNPRDALETFFWALNAGNPADLARLMRLTGAAKAQADALYATLPPEARQQYASPEEVLAVFAASWASDLFSDTSVMKVLSESDPSPDTSVLKVQISPTGEWGLFPASYSAGGGWQFAVPDWIVARAEKNLLGPAGNPEGPAQ